MERERLTDLLNDPTQVGRDDLAGLKDLTDRNPWFAAGHLLVASGEHALGDVRYDTSLQAAVAHLPVRSVLYDVVHGEKAAPTSLRILPKDPPAQETEQIGNEPEPAGHSGTGTLDGIDPTASEPEPPPTTTDVLDAEIRRAALASSYELLMEHAPEQALSQGTPFAEASPDNTASPEGPAIDGPTLEEAVIPANILDQEPLPPIAELPLEPAPMIIRGRMRFTEWLEADGTSGSVGTVPITPPVEIEVPPSVDTVPERAVDIADSRSLIDQFIAQTLPAPRPKAEFFTPQQAAKRSLDDTAGIVTETLARIYAKQGNIAKAKEAYHKLALKFPDKSAYFAALSKALEEH